MNLLLKVLERCAFTYPRAVVAIIPIVTLGLVMAAAMPMLVPAASTLLPTVKIDTNPENMLAADTPVRLAHKASRKVFDQHDLIIVGLINEQHPAGVFNPADLARIQALSQFAAGLRWPDASEPGAYAGVISADMMAPSMVDVVRQGSPGEVSFAWLMPAPPATAGEAVAVRDLALSQPLLANSMVSADGRGIALYLPLTDKSVAHRVRQALLEFTRDWPEQAAAVHITGLPVAEETFGIEMFVQMAISAPLALLVIFLLLWWFFRQPVLILAPMIVAVTSAMTTMGLLILSGNTIHIMSSMIPIFIMPIAVLDSVHLLSAFADRYREHGDRIASIRGVLRTLFQPMLFTTLTTMTGFASLALTPIPPVQVFGLFVAAGVFIAWLSTILFIPAYIALLPGQRLHKLARTGGQGKPDSLLTALGSVAGKRPRLIVMLNLLLLGIALIGIARIEVNDNPLRWFHADHPIRVADRALSQHFAGSYMAYLHLRADDQADRLDRTGLSERLQQAHAAVADYGIEDLDSVFAATAARIRTSADLQALTRWAGAQQSQSGKKSQEAWDEILLVLDQERLRAGLFKQPEVLRWVRDLQDYLQQQPVVGKTSSIVDLVQTVYRELLPDSHNSLRLPDSSRAVAQTLLTFQNSHRPQDLWHFTTPDHREASIWLQLKSGDNRDMQQLVTATENWLAAHPPPRSLHNHWYGLTWINVVWQQEMVSGMTTALLGSFIVVLIMMSLLFRSLLWGLLSMLPLTVTVATLYGAIGLAGKDYDMPVAVLSALSLGLAVDYAIHYLARVRTAWRSGGTLHQALTTVSGEPAIAIYRNAVILGAGFTPLLLAPLVPYQTVGLLVASILFTAALVTLLLLPALITLLEAHLRPDRHQTVTGQ